MALDMAALSSVESALCISIPYVYHIQWYQQLSFHISIVTNLKKIGSRLVLSTLKPNDIYWGLSAVRLVLQKSRPNTKWDRDRHSDSYYFLYFLYFYTFWSSFLALSNSLFSDSSLTAASQISSLLPLAWKARASIFLAAGTSPCSNKRNYTITSKVWSREPTH